MSLDIIGNLMHLSMAEISIKEGINVPSFLIKAAADRLKLSGYNWVPVIVREVEEDKYEVIGNSFVYAVAEEAQLEKIWCIIADTSNETEELAKILSGEKTPKINLSIADTDDIKAALQYLIEKQGSELKGVNLLSTTARIYEAADRKYWKNLEPITKLKCGITAAKVKVLNQIFYLTPEVQPDPDPSSIDLKRLTVAQLKALAKEKGITGCSKKTKAILIKELGGG
jgi:hypothetical protein